MSNVAQNKLFIPNSNSSEYEVNKESKDTIQYFFGDVQAYQDDVFMFCDTAQIISDILIAKGNVVFVQSDTIEVYADSVVYNSRLKNAKLFNNVILDNVDQKLFTDYLYYDFLTREASYQDTALIVKDHFRLQSKKGTYSIGNQLAMFYEDVIIRDSLLNLRADSLRYDMDLSRAIFICPTEMKTDSAVVYCESGYHSFDDNISFLTGNPQVIKSDLRVSGDTIVYQEQDEIMTIFGKGFYIDSEQSATGEYLYFNQITGESVMSGYAEYRDSSTHVLGDFIRRNAIKETIEVYKDAYFSNEPMVIEADSLIYNEASESGTARGGVAWQDTSNATTIFCDIADYNLSNESMQAYNLLGKPYMMNVDNQDTLYLSADTLFATEIIVPIDSITIDTNKVLIAFPNAGIFKYDLQALCDSLTYNQSDATIFLVGKPIMWSDSTQFIGDTIKLLLDSNKLDRVQIIEKGFISTELEEATYDQIKGKRIDAHFVDGSIDNMLIVGNAEAIYYLKDEEEDAYIGANKTICSKMHFYFENDSLNNIRFFDNPTSVMTPTDKINPYDMRLEGFLWRIKERPLSLRDILK